MLVGGETRQGSNTPVKGGQVQYRLFSLRLHFCSYAWPFEDVKYL